ncbi:MAG: hypothetical protein HZC02_00805 [Candidatus Levybacteria bacterium]|nr:hypothetical protein [Candidatus Levybacteria bacterium]
MRQDRVVFGPGVKDTPGIAGWMIILIILSVFALGLGGLQAFGVIKIDTWLQGARNEREDVRTEGIIKQLDWVLARKAEIDGFLQDFDLLAPTVQGFDESEPATWSTSQKYDVEYMCAAAVTLDDEDLHQYVSPRAITLMNLHGCRK